MVIKITATNKERMTEHTALVIGDHRTYETLRDLFFTNTVAKSIDLDFKISVVKEER